MSCCLGHRYQLLPWTLALAFSLAFGIGFWFIHWHQLLLQSQILIMIVLIVRAFYHLRKPRVLTPIDKSFLAYERKMRQIRRGIHRESVEYMQQIEDKYLHQHKQAMRKFHFENECAFRKQVFIDAWRLSENLRKSKQRDQEFSSRLNKHLHDQDVRKINRSRIIKIMEHESSNYWFNSQNAGTRLQEETVFPEYVASSEYYYKLFAEALAYELGDLQQVHRMTSNEQTIREKNKYMIPLYLELRSKIGEFKRDAEKELLRQHLIRVDRVKQSAALSQEQIDSEVASLNESFQRSLQDVRAAETDQAARLRELSAKMHLLLYIFKTWKDYTNILGMTSAQIIKNQLDLEIEPLIYKAEKQYLSNIKSRKAQTFVDSMEEDTQQVQVTFEEYVTKINRNRRDQHVPAEDNVGLQELDSLFSSIQPELQHARNTPAIDLDSGTLDLSKLLGQNPATAGRYRGQSGKEEQINPQYFNPKETTSSVQILKEQFKGNKQIQELLEKLGEIDVRYPKLFQKIWDSVQAK